MSDDIRLVDENSDRATKCRHFNGTMNARCKAGVAYEDVRLDHDPIPYRHARDGRPRGSVYSMSRSTPCLGKYNLGGATCPKHELYSPEEIAEQKAESSRSMDLMRRGLSSCCEAAIDESRVIREGRHKGHGPRYCSKCGRCVFIV